MSKGGKRRKFIFPKKFFTGDYMPEVITTGEQRNKQTVLTSLFSIFQIIAKNPAVLQDQTMQRIFNQIMEISGESPALMNAGAAKSLPQPAQAQGAPASAANVIPTQTSATPATAGV
jgi:hypothetical protein